MTESSDRPRFCLSIVTITKDDPVGLDRTIASTVELRRRRETDHLIVDGGVILPTPLIEGIRVLKQQGSGIAAAFNEGLAAAQGEWIWFLNGGDTVHPKLPQNWLLQLLAATAADIVAGSVQYDGDAAPRPSRLLREQWPPLISWIPHPSAVIRRRLLLQTGGFDERWSIATDFDLWLKLLYHDVRVDVVSVPFACFDVTGISQRADTRRRLAQENAGVLWRYKIHLLRAWLATSRHALGALWRAWRQR